MIYGQERLAATASEVKALLVEHRDEVSSFKDIPLITDDALYLQAEEAGCLRLYTAREGGVLVGYAVFWLLENPHHVGSLQANQDGLYLRPANRIGWAGAGFIRFIEQQLKAESAQLVYHHAKPGSPMDRLLPMLGYQLMEHVHAKRLDWNGG